MSPILHMSLQQHIFDIFRHDFTYPLARNQFINSCQEHFFLHSPACEDMRHMHLHRNEFPTATVSIQREGVNVQIHVCEGANTYCKNNSSIILSCICASANTGPACTCAKINSSRFFPACTGFVPGGISSLLLSNNPVRHMPVAMLN